MSELKNIIQMYLDWCKTYRSKTTTQDYAQFFKSFLQVAETYNDESIELLLHKIDNHHVHNYLS